MPKAPTDAELVRYPNFACDVAGYLFIVRQAQCEGTAKARASERTAENRPAIVGGPIRPQKMVRLTFSPASAEFFFPAVA